MELHLQDRVVVVSGGSSGIGLATSRALVAEGARVLLASRSSTRLAAAAEVFAEGPGSVAFVDLDIRNSRAGERLLVAAEEHFGVPYGLVNSAGSVRIHDLIDGDEAEWHEQWDLNVEAPRRLIDAVAPAMAANGGGSIVNVASSAGRRPSATYPAYSVAKRGQLALTQVYAQRLAPHGVLVNAVAPGPTETPLWHGPDGLLDQFGVRSPEDRNRAVEERGQGLPLGRLAEAEEIASAIVFLLAASSQTGVILPVDGGHVAETSP